MSLILRIIRKSRWYFKPDWLPNGDIQADALADLVTKNNELSVWEIRKDRSNLNRIIAALAAKRDFLSNFDYVLFDKKILQENGLKFRTTKGVSLDEEANDLWHLNLYELSASKIANLALAIADYGELRRVPEKEVRDIVTDAITQGTIKFDSLSQHLKKKVLLS